MTLMMIIIIIIIIIIIMIIITIIIIITTTTTMIINSRFVPCLEQKFQGLFKDTFPIFKDSIQC